MSLRPDDHRSSRSRTKSPGRARERSRSRSRLDEGPAFATDPRLTSSYADAQSSSTTPQYEIRQPGLSSYPTHAQHPSRPPGHQQLRTDSDMDGYTMGGFTDLPPSERPGYVSPTGAGAQQQQQWTYTPTPVNSAAPTQPLRNPVGGHQQQPANYQYSQPEGIKYTAKPITSQPSQQYPPPPPVPHRYSTSVTSPGHNVTAMPMPQQYFPPPPSGPPPSKKNEKYDPHLAYGADNARIVEVKPGGGRIGAPPSPGLAPRMDRLSVTGNRPNLQPIMPGAYPGGEGGMGGGFPPPSPLLEAYHGTYQSLSPMPSPIMRPLDDGLDDLPPLDAREEKKHRKHRHRSSSNVSHGQSSSLSISSAKKDRERSRSRVRDSQRDKEREREREREKEKASKRVKIYDAEEDASAILKALTPRDPDADVLIDILPVLSHDQLMELRTEYKRVCKVQGRGVNLAKHIKMKLPSSNFGKVCHITALGRWESESYWANYWYQGNNSKRELLIESLMGRSNYEIHEIIDSFKDKRYGDDLVRCMETELKKDKFRTAILLALDANRQEEGDVQPLEYRNRDVDAMYSAVRAREGGETDILRIVCTRSDAHLRECLEVYKRKYQSNFAKDVLRKSNNLVVGGAFSPQSAPPPSY